MERYIYQGKDCPEQLREYIGSSYDFTHIYPGCELAEDSEGVTWANRCTVTEMKQWGSRITIDQAKEIINNYDEQREAAISVWEMTQVRREEKNIAYWTKKVNDVRQRLIASLTIEELQEELKKRELEL